MGRILFWVVLALAAYALWRGWRRSQRRARMGTERTTAIDGESMVSCRVCGLNVPRSEAVVDGEHRYCSEEHRQKMHPET